MKTNTRMKKARGGNPGPARGTPPKTGIKEGETLMVRIQQINQSTKSKRNSNTGGIHQLPSGNWELRWYVTDESGNRKRVSTTVKGSKTEANKKLREFLKNVDDGKHVDKSKETTSHFMGLFMKAHVAKNALSGRPKGIVATSSGT